MPAFMDLTGHVYGRWTVDKLSERRGNSKYPSRYWDCTCSCPDRTQKAVCAGDLRNGISRSCGCLRRETSRATFTTHGLSKHPAWNSWHAMVQRCTDATRESWKHYGGRGITVCPEWLDIRAFLTDMEATFKPGLSIEREDNDGMYCKSNCYWATEEEQANNKRSSHLINTPIGRMTVTRAARAYGLEVRTLFERISLGWAEDRLFTPARDQATCINTPDGPMTVTEAERKYGFVKGTISSRIRYGWPESDLLRPTNRRPK